MSMERIILGVAAVVVCAGAGVCFAELITVNWDGSGDYTTIQAAIDVALNGDTVIVEDGTYIENINFGGKNLTLTSTDPEDPNVVAATIIDGGGLGSVITFGGTEAAECELAGFTITGGYTTGHGGGIQTMGASTTISRCIIRNNTSEGAGGAIQNYYGKISHCIVKENQAVAGGAFAGCRGPIVNCLVVGNSADYGVAFNNCDGDIVNCTVVGNSAAMEGIFQVCDGTVTNCIIWDNDGDVFYDCLAEITYNCFPDASGEGNIDVEPLFVDEANGDYRLVVWSPCVDSGTNSPAGGLSEFDLDSNNRLIDGDNDTVATVDMGAYEMPMSNKPVIKLSEYKFEFVSFEGGANPESQVFIIRNSGLGVLNWQITEDCEWLSISPESGESMGEEDEVMISVDIMGLSGGDYSSELTISALGALNSPQTVTVELFVCDLEEGLWVPFEYPTIQSAIDAAVYGDTVHVFAGTYIENITLKNGVSIVGDSAEDTIIDGNQKDSVVKSQNCDRNTILEGFILTNGKAVENEIGFSYGGGILNYHSSPVIKNCIIQSNYAMFGGGIYNNEYCNSIIRNCKFINNSSQFGGGVYNFRSDLKVLDSFFTDNIGWIGGGLSNESYSDATIINCVFTANQSPDYGGGGLFNYKSNATVINCIFAGNSSDEGGGMANVVRSNAIVANCIFSGNQCFHKGGGLRIDYDSDIKVINCVFTENQSHRDGGGIANSNESYLNISNCILWENYARYDGDEVYNSSNSTSVINHSDISNCGKPYNWDSSLGIDGGGNIDIDPLFKDADGNDNIIGTIDDNLHLKPYSLCIDAGDNEALPGYIEIDLDGNPRIINGIVDMGAYEFNPVKVSVDIKPGACPNPINVKSKGVLPVAILGTDVFEVSDIDISSIRMEGIAPIRSSFEDVATPTTDPNECACTTEGPDGYVDLMLKFETQEIIAMLSEVIDGEEWMLSLTGTLYDGTEIEGTDCIIIRKKGTKE